MLVSSGKWRILKLLQSKFGNSCLTFHFSLHCLDILDRIGLLCSCTVSEGMLGGKVKDLGNNDAT